MATDKDNKYDYKKVTLYFDLNNHNQNEAYNLIKKAGHKQTKLIGILVHFFSTIWTKHFLLHINNPHHYGFIFTYFISFSLQTKTIG